jgi:type VI secretion system protein VasG
VDDCRRRIQALETELSIIARESAIGIDAVSREESASGALAVEKERLVDLEARWGTEKALVDRVLALRAQLREGAAPVEGQGAGPDRAALLAELKGLQAELATHQGETPLILPSVDEQAVATVVEDWTGIPVGRMVKNEVQAVLNLATTLSRRVIGQDHALSAIAKRVQTARAGLDNPSKPIGVFMLCGPSGVAPPGYIGYGEGGVLTEAVRRKPYSVVLLDEVEKAHPDVHEIFFQVFDKGIMEDGEGRLIDFKNTLIILTSNAGTDLIMSMCRDPELMPEPDEVAKALREPLLKVFPPALLGRLLVIPYYPLGDAMMGDIIRLQLNRIAARILDHHKVPFTYDDAVVKLIASRCTEPESGGRMIDAILTNTMLPAISGAFLTRLMDGDPIARVQVGVADGEFTYAFA